MTRGTHPGIQLKPSLSLNTSESVSATVNSEDTNQRMRHYTLQTLKERDRNTDVWELWE
jgi:hypothetical protein